MEVQSTEVEAKSSVSPIKLNTTNAFTAQEAAVNLMESEVKKMSIDQLFYHSGMHPIVDSRLWRIYRPL